MYDAFVIFFLVHLSLRLINSHLLNIHFSYHLLLFLPACSTSDCPRLGSLCQVRVSLKADTEEGDSLVSVKRNENLTCQSGITEATVFPRCLDSVLQVPLGEWMTLRLGEGQCDVTEACLERMRAGEKCEVRVMMGKKNQCFHRLLMYYY